MEHSIWFMIGLQLFLIALNAIFACAEIAVISMNDNKMEKMAEEGDKRAIRLVKLTSQPARFLATIQVAITLSGFLGSAFAAENFSGVLVDWLLRLGVPLPAEVLNSVAVVLITILLSYVTLVLGELVPKQIAMRKAESLALSMSGFIRGVAKIFAPLVSLLTVSTNGVLRLLGIDPDAEEEQVSEEEIRMMVDVGSEKGAIDSEEREFIQNVFDFDNMSVEELMTHRTEVTLLDTEDSIDAWKETIFDTRYTYYPVCNGTPDQIIGVLNTKKYFRLKENTMEAIMEQAVSPAYFVPNTLKADSLFRNMKREKVGLAVVLDEYGGMEGIITIKDLAEELVGDLEDDVTEVEEELVMEEIEPDTWRVDGGVMLEDLSETVGVDIFSEEYDTLHGLIFHMEGAVPEPGTVVEVENLEIHVDEMQNNQVKHATVIKKTVEETVEEE